MRRPWLPPIYLILLLLTLPGCGVLGVRFSNDARGTELFKDLELSGDLKPNSQLTVTIEVTQGYPVPVRIACYWENGDKLSDDQKKLAYEERANQVGETVLPAASGHKPGDKDLPKQSISYSFSVPEAGDYFIACFTPAAPENGMGMSFTVSGS